MQQYELLWQYQQVDMELDQYEREMRNNSNRKELLKHRDFLMEQQNVLKKIESGEADYHIVEVMCCPGGCVNGGGQPTQPASVRNFVDLKKLRADVLYKADRELDLRKSHENSIIKQIYAEFLGEPNSHKAHELLHTHYVKRGL